MAYLLSKGARLTAKSHENNILHSMITAFPAHDKYEDVMALFDVIVSHEDAKALSKLPNRIF